MLPCTHADVVRVSDLWNVRLGLLRLYACELYDLAPFLSFIGNEFVKGSSRARKHNPAGFSEARSCTGVGEACIDLLVEPFNDIGRRIPGRAETIPGARFVARHELAHRWDIGQRLRATRSCHSKSAQFASFHVLN